MAILASKAGDEIVQFDFPRIEWRFRFDLCQATRKAAVLGGVRRIVNAHRLNDINGHGNCKASGDRIDGLGRVDQQDPLVFRLAVKIQLSVRRANHPRS